MKLTFTGEGQQSKIGSDNDHVRIGMSPKVASDGPKSQAEDAATRRRVALVSNRLNYASGSVL